MQITDEQKQKIAAWIAEGMSLSNIQDRMGKELEIRCTYMEARMLVDDLKLTPKDVEPPAPKVPPAAPVPEAAAASTLLTDDSPAPVGKVALTVDQIARPGTMVSGDVTFSDGKTAKWHLDQQGQLRVVAGDPAYRPIPSDVEEFQVALDRELQKMGF